jgi:NADH:ubiquinone oxidoreductase subunit E
MVTEIKVCMGSACFAKGNQDNLQLIKEYIDENNLNAEVTIVGSLCKNKCEHGPRIIVGDVEYNKVTQEELLEILKKNEGK